MAQIFEKRRERHAIGEFSAEIRFFQPLDTSAFASAVATLRAFAEAERLPAPISTRTFAFNLEKGDPTPMPATSSAGWQRFAPDGEPELSVMCDPSLIAFTTRRYTTWEDMLPRLKSFFGTIAKSYIQTVPGVSAIQVRYLNEFRSLSASADSGKELFRKGSPWLPMQFLSFQDAWHSHCGAFEDISELSRRLVNMNVDCRTAIVEDQPNPATLITALIIVAQKFDIPGKPPLVLSQGDLVDEIGKQFDIVHSREKELLAELLTDEYLVSIGAKDANK